MTPYDERRISERILSRVKSVLKLQIGWFSKTRLSKFNLLVINCVEPAPRQVGGRRKTSLGLILVMFL